jgi:lipopolysaccharide transport system ATP-binding protein
MSNSDDVLIKVDNVSKKFCRSLKRSMLYGIEDISRDLLHLPNNSDKLRKDEFWAVDDVSFEVRRGECLGIIGRNGAGKSTLLKMLNGIILPDKGKITIKGKVGALIEVGAGFHPMLTGRENVYVNGAILGMSKQEIDKKFDEIVAFAELEEFIDMPVKHYSSGMYVRLGFSVAAHLNLDVLLIDEALAVGDLAFTIKCLNRIAALRRNSTSVIFVSHNELQVREAANRCIVMSSGQLIGDGDLNEAFFLYNQYCANKNLGGLHDTGFVHDGSICMGSCTVEPVAPSNTITSGDGLRISIHCRTMSAIKDVSLELRIWNVNEQLVTSINPSDINCQLDVLPGESVISVYIPMLALVPGRYRLAGGFRKNGEFLGWARDLAHFDVTLSPYINAGCGFFITPATFTIEQVID